jgi:hypothetical protein
MNLDAQAVQPKANTQKTATSTKTGPRRKAKRKDRRRKSPKYKMKTMKSSVAYVGNMKKRRTPREI